MTANADNGERARRKRLNSLASQLERLGYGGDERKRDDAAIADIRRKLRAKPVETVAPPSRIAPISYRRDMPRIAKPRRPSVATEAAVPLEAGADGRELRHNPHGKYYFVETPINDIDGEGDLAGRFTAALEPDDSWLRGRLRIGCSLEYRDPGDFVFWDIESTGLGSASVFLIGAMVWNGNGFAVHQFLARNYAEEAGVIAAFQDLCQGRRALVTFNGKTFDHPFIRMRCAGLGVPFVLDHPHFDLLHESRRVWRGQLPDCKLQTLESCICRRPRHGDIPGADIPDAYHDFVRTGNAVRIHRILHHNLLDLVTLADLMARFPRQVEP